jgi:Fibrinogen beta and gamma chains, C-terminal globular domain
MTKYLVKMPGQDDVLTPSVSQWIAFLWRKANSSDGNWDLLWNDYVNGFGFQATNLWLGLERIHQLTTSGNWSLRLEYFYNNKWVSAEYQKFVVGDNSSFYTLNYQG